MQTIKKFKNKMKWITEMMKEEQSDKATGQKLEKEYGQDRT